VFFIATSVYGWWRWSRNRRSGGGVCFFVFRAVGAGFPVPWWYYLADSWIFVGSVLATYAMARRWLGRVTATSGRPGATSARSERAQNQAIRDWAKTHGIEVPNEAASHAVWLSSTRQQPAVDQLPTASREWRS
jgi:hypothetical protein